MVTTVQFQPARLPAFGSPRIRQLGWTTGSDRYDAYAKVLQAEEYAIQLLREAEALQLAEERNPAIRAAQGKIVAISVAGHLFLEFESHYIRLGVGPSEALVRWFVSPPPSSQLNHHDVIIACGTNLRDNFIRPFRTSNAPYRVPSSRPSRASFDSLADMIQETMAASDRNYSTIRKKVLARDGYRCVVTGVYNAATLDRCPEFRNLFVKASPLEMAYIFTKQGIEPADSEGSKTYPKTSHASHALVMLQTFGYSKLADTFATSEGVHEPWNLLFLHYDAHTLFDKLELWLEHTDTPHRYQVCTARAYEALMIKSVFEDYGRQVDDGGRRFVEFNVTYEEVPPPDPLLLTLHAACARVVHMSGAADFFDQVEQDEEETKVLANDGSTSTLLDHLLSPFVAPVPGVA